MDILWHSDRVFRKAEGLGPQPDWNGFMENITADCRYAPQKITIGMSPPTDLNTGDESYTIQLCSILKIRQKV